jgi:hypothetical protein
VRPLFGFAPRLARAACIPASILGQFNIEAIHPDEFLTRLWDEQPNSVLEAVRLQRAGLKNPPKTPVEYLTTLEQCRLPEIAACLLPHAMRFEFRSHRRVRATPVADRTAGMLTNESEDRHFC